jgi:hypothetical protein
MTLPWSCWGSRGSSHPFGAQRTGVCQLARGGELREREREREREKSLGFLCGQATSSFPLGLYLLGCLFL